MINEVLMLTGVFFVISIGVLLPLGIFIKIMDKFREETNINYESKYDNALDNDTLGTLGVDDIAAKYDKIIELLKEINNKLNNRGAPIVIPQTTPQLPIRWDNKGPNDYPFPPKITC